MNGDSIAARAVVGLPVAVGLELFKNRRSETADIAAALAAPGKRLVTVVGRRGIGKSALAARVMRAIELDAWPPGIDGPSSRRDGFRLGNFSSRTDGISFERIFHDCARLFDADQADELRRLWAGPQSAADKAAELVGRLGADTLLLLDNLEDVLSPDGQVLDDDLRAFLRLVFRSARAPRLLVTTQIPLALPIELRRLETRIRLDAGLPLDEAIELLRELDADGETLRDAPRSRLTEAVERVHGVPRALELVVGAMAGDYLTLPSLDEVLADFTVRGDVVANLAQERYRTVGGDARLALDALAVIGRPATRDAVAWILAPLAANLDVAAVLADLARQHMLSVDRASRTFRLHPMDVDLIRGELGGYADGLRRSLDRRTADWYLRNSPPPEAWRTVDDVQLRRYEFEHRLAAGDVHDAALVLAEIDEFLVWRGSIGAVLRMRGELDGRLTEPESVLTHLLGIGLVRLVAGPLDQGVEPLRRAEELAVELADRIRLERVLFVLGEVYRMLRRLDEAIDAHIRAAALAAELGDLSREGHTRMCLSLAYSYRGDVDRALASADRLTEIAAAVDDPLLAGREGDARSLAYLVAGRWDESIAAADAAVDAYTRAGVPEALGYARNTRGLAELGRGEPDRATESFDEAWRDGMRQQSARLQGLALFNRSWAAWTAGRLDEAVHHIERAVTAFDASGSPDVAAATVLRDAVRAMSTSDSDVSNGAAAELLRRTAESVSTNADLVPGRWLLVEADRLDPPDSRPAGP